MEKGKAMTSVEEIEIIKKNIDNKNNNNNCV